MKLRSKWITGIFIFLCSFTISPISKATEELHNLENNEIKESNASIYEDFSINELPLTEQSTQQEKLIPSATEQDESSSSEETSVYLQEVGEVKEVAEIDSEQNKTTEEIHTKSYELAKNSKIKTNKKESFIRKSGYIIWDDRNDKEGFRPDAVEITLYQNDKK
ncbi:MAG: hypothetical protein KBT36_13635 [Kurthia sp.]|nr:hypothetical protein [Candidatus Kurthia equi]